MMWYASYLWYVFLVPWYTFWYMRLQRSFIFHGYVRTGGTFCTRVLLEILVHHTIRLILRPFDDPAG